MTALGASHVWKGDNSRGGHHLLIGGICESGCANLHVFRQASWYSSVLCPCDFGRAICLAVVQSAVCTKLIAAFVDSTLLLEVASIEMRRKITTFSF